MRKRRWPPSCLSANSRLPVIKHSAKMILGIMLVLHLCTFSDAQSFLDSRLVGAPQIFCEESRIQLFIRTNEPFGGNVYAKGFFDKDICRVRGNGIGNTANITIPVAADCGMRRRRMVDPKGLILELTIVLMFHNTFLTRNDKAYHIECVYMEMSQKVYNRLDISAIPSTQLSESVNVQNDISALPKCKYEVLDKDENGQAISFAAIGQPIYHHWTCQNSGGSTLSQAEEKLYCLTVHSCEVDDGQGNVQKLLDANGCPVDRTLLEDVDYLSDLEAGRRSFVFKFADRPTIYFSCQLRLELKSEWKQKCRRTSGRCKTMKSQNAKTIATTPIGYGDRDESENIDDFTYVSNSSSSSVTSPGVILTTPLTTSTVSEITDSFTTRFSTMSNSLAGRSTPKSKLSYTQTDGSEGTGIIDIPLLAPAQNVRNKEDDVWLTVVNLPRGRDSSKEVLPADMPKDVTLQTEDGEVVAKYIGDSNEKHDILPSNRAPIDEEQLSHSIDDGAVLEEDDATANSAASVPISSSVTQRHTQLQTESPAVADMLVLKRRGISHSTVASYQRLTHYDAPVDAKHGRVEKFHLKQSRPFGSDVSENSLESIKERQNAVTTPYHGTFVDIDVTAPQVDVFDVPQIHNNEPRFVHSAVIHNSNGVAFNDDFQYTHASEQMEMRDGSLQGRSLNQVCISHKVLSMVLFISSLVLICVFVMFIVTFQKFRQRTFEHRKYLESNDYPNDSEDGAEQRRHVPTRRLVGVTNLKTAYTLHNTPYSSATIA